MKRQRFDKPKSRAMEKAKKQEYAQGDVLIAKQDFGMKRDARSRGIKVKKGDRFSVTSTKLYLKDYGLLLIDRVRSATIGHGYPVTPEQVEELFNLCQSEE